MRTNPVVILICLLIFGYYTGCGTDIAGSGSQTTNGVTIEAKSKSISVKADPGLNVSVYSSEYVTTGYSESVILDDPHCRFDSLPEGWYTVIVKSNNGKAVIFQEVPVNSLQQFCKTGKLQTTGSVSGSVFKADSPISQYLVFIRGTPLKCISVNGMFKLDSVPVSNYQVSVRNTATVDSIPDDSLETVYQVKVDEENPHQILNIER